MMGRLRNVLSHTRDISMVMTEKTITYKIPIYLEKNNLGSFVGASIIDGNIILKYSACNDVVSELKADKYPDASFVVRMD